MSTISRKKIYDQLESLTSSPNPEVSRLSTVVKNLKERIERLEKENTELLNEIIKLKKGRGRIVTSDGRKKKARAQVYACTLCDVKFTEPKELQKHRKEIHKAPYNI